MQRCPPPPFLTLVRRVEDCVCTIIILTQGRSEQVLQTWALCKGNLHSQATLLLAVLARFNSGASPAPSTHFPRFSTPALRCSSPCPDTPPPANSNPATSPNLTAPADDIAAFFQMLGQGFHLGTALPPPHSRCRGARCAIRRRACVERAALRQDPQPQVGEPDAGQPAAALPPRFAC